jgi:hypothetical protein
VASVEIPLLRAMAEWYCPNCWVTDTAPPPPPGQVRFHNCPGLHGLSAPLVQKEVSCKVWAQEREDYLDGEVQAMGDDGRAYMAVVTTRDDGQDVAVNAGLARARLGDYR